jgi:uncharacterized SAM-binding protein YcdF (DUF218 family)
LFFRRRTMSTPSAQPESRSPFARRVLWLQALLAVPLLACVPFVGAFLFSEDPLERADAIFVLAGPRASRWLEARDLFEQKLAPIVLLSGGLREDAERIAVEQGARVPSEGELARNALVDLGVPPAQVVILPGRPDNTAEEAAGLREYALAHGWRTVIVVTSKLHTRRASVAMRRALAGTTIRIVMRSTRYDGDDPARWWLRRTTIRRVIYEAPALVAYLLGLGS